jgi:hypothetical protein
MADSIQEVVPDVVKVAGRMAASSVITGRRRVRLVPQSGQNYTSGASSGIVNILIQDGQAYADLLSACLSFNVTVYDSANYVAAGATPTLTKACVLDDGAYSVFRRALVSVNSTLMDDIDVLPKKVNAELYATASQAWYNTVGSFIGLWKHSTVTPKPTDAAGVIAGTGDVFLSKYDVSSKVIEQAKKVQGTGQFASAAGASAAFQPGQNQFSVPVSLLSSFFRNDTLFPSRNAGQLYLQLNLASAVEAMLCAGPSPVPSYNITNLTCEIEYVDMHPTYLSLLDDLIEAPTGAGVNWAFDAHLCTSQSIGSGPGQKSVIVSKASQNMRSLQVVAQPDSALASSQWLSQSTFQNPALVDIQLRIGSLYYPAFPAIGEHRAYMDLQNAFGSPESTDKSGIIDTVNYYTNTPDTFANATGGALAAVGSTGVASPAPIPNQNNLGTLVVSKIPRSAWTDAFMYAYCFDRLKHAKFHGLDLDGINTLTSSGSQMVVQLNCNPAASTTLTSIARFTRVLHLGAGATSVIG